jgi:hypothetical protein
MGKREVGWGMDWNDLVQGKDRQRALVNVVKNFCIYEMWGIPSLAEKLLASQEGFCPGRILVLNSAGSGRGSLFADFRNKLMGSAVSLKGEKYLDKRND